MNRTRIIVDVILVTAVFFAPFPVVVAVALLGLFLLPRWWEVIACGVVLDLLYHGGDGTYFSDGSAILFTATTISVLLFLIGELLRVILRERLR